MNLHRDLDLHVKLVTSFGPALLRYQRPEPDSTVVPCSALSPLGICHLSLLPDGLFAKGKIDYISFFHSKHFLNLFF